MKRSKKAPAQARKGLLGRYAPALEAKRRAVGTRVRSYENLKLRFEGGKPLVYSEQLDSPPAESDPAGTYEGVEARPDGPTRGRREPVSAGEGKDDATLAAAADPTEASKPRELRGRPVVDRDGNELGTVEAVRGRPATGSPAWAALTASVDGRGLIVPLTNAVIEEDRVTVGYGQAWVRAAPSVEAGAELCAQQEDRLLGHYGLSRSGSPSPSGASTAPPGPAPVQAPPPGAEEAVAARPTLPVAGTARARVAEGQQPATRRDRSEAPQPNSEPPAPRVRGPSSRIVERSSRAASPQRESYRGLSLRAAFMGWLSAIGLLALLGTLVGGLLGSTASSADEVDGRSAVGIAALVLSVFAAYFVGGYVAGRIARSTGARHGLSVWAIALFVAVALALLSAVAGAPLNLLAAVGFPRLLVDGESVSGGAAIALATIIGSLIAAVVGGKLGAHPRGEARRSQTSSSDGQDAAHDRSMPTWSGLRRTELLAFPAAVAGVLIATQLVDTGDGGGLGALQGWTLAAALSIGYMVSRGFAKSRFRLPARKHLGSATPMPDEHAGAASENDSDQGELMAVERSRGSSAGHPGRETETKASYKTSELILYVMVVVGILIASNVIEAADGGGDYFRGDKAWLYITILTVGYMVSRGLAKSGSRDPYESRTKGGGIGERLGAAVEAFREEPGTDRGRKESEALTRSNAEG